MFAHKCSAPISIMVSFIFLTLISRIYARENYKEYYEKCKNTARSCGTLNFGYPFWGNHSQPEYCGVQDYELSCEDSQLYTNIGSGAGTKYRVTYIDQETNTLELERPHDIVDDICNTSSINSAILNDKVYGYSDDAEDFYFYYNCPSEIYLTYAGNNFNCSFGNTDRNVLFGNKGFFKAQGDKLRLCDEVTVPAKKIVTEIFPEDVVKQLRQLLQRRFEVQYYIDKKACSYCTKNDWLCWRDTNLATNKTCLTENGVQSIHEGRKNNNSVIIGAVAGALGGSMLLLLLVFFICYRSKRAKHVSPVVSQSVSSYSFSISDTEKGGRNDRGVPIFAYSELEKATNNFDASNELGNGGFGTVYKGKLQDGREVAVKRLYENNFKRVEQFMNEIAILEPLRHQNLVVLYGSTSSECRKLLLVYEYIPNGTIADHLYGDNAKPGRLSWKTRMSIAVETASALSYLHAKEVIHRDVKTTNILLDNTFHVKVADFGLSRLFPTNVTHISTAPQGTPGYVDPEYHQCYQLTSKSDVYSFGVVLIELISSLPAVDISRHQHEINLSNMAISKIQGDALHELVDPTLGFDSDSEVHNMITEVAELAFTCLQNGREMRPSMKEVRKTLKEIQRKYYAGKNEQEVDLADDALLLKDYHQDRSPNSVATKWASKS